MADELAVVLLLSLPLLAQPDAQLPPAPSERRLAYLIESPQPPRDAVFHALLAAGSPGGIVSGRSCENAATLAFRATEGMTLGEALTHISSVRGGGARWLIADGVPNVILDAGWPELLDVKIDHLALRDARNLELSVDQLEQAPEVRRYLAASKMTHWLRGSIYATLRKEGEKAPEVDPLEITNTTVSKVMNTLAGRHGRAIWGYRENACPGRPRTFDLEFNGR